MFEKILFATDFSGYAQKTLECITGFPGVQEVILLHVIEEARSPRGGGEMGTELFQEEKQLLREEKHHLESICHGIRVTTAVKSSSDIAGAILDAAEEMEVTLIVVGARGKNILEGIHLGSVSLAVLRQSRISLLIMRHRIIGNLSGRTYEMLCPMILSRVLCPVDFSHYSVTAIELASATPGVGEIVLLHVVSQDEAGADIADAVRVAKDRIMSIRENLTAKGIATRAIVKTGNAATEIINTADEEAVSVIWISSIGKGWFREIMVGSTARTVTLHAKHPVIVIHAPACREPGEWKLTP